MWWIVSASWSQRRHFSGWSRPRRAKRSAVQQRFREASQMKDLHLGGAQVFQILCAGSNRTFPLKKRPYADLDEYSLEAEWVQRCWSGTPGCSWKPCIKFQTSSNIIHPTILNQRIPHSSGIKIFFGTQEMRAGATPDNACPWSQWSVQKQVWDPSPTKETTEQANMAAAWGWILISMSQQ